MHMHEIFYVSGCSIVFDATPSPAVHGVITSCFNWLIYKRVFAVSKLSQCWATTNVSLPLIFSMCPCPCRPCPWFMFSSLCDPFYMTLMQTIELCRPRQCFDAAAAVRPPRLLCFVADDSPHILCAQGRQKMTRLAKVTPLSSSRRQDPRRID